MLPWAEYWYNMSYHGATGMTPFKALYGRDPPNLIKWTYQPLKVQVVEQQLKKRNQVLVELKAQLEQAQSQMKDQANKHKREVEFNIGESIYLKLKPCRFKSLARKPNEKLSPRYYGPYEILERLGKVAYRLKLPHTAKIHNVFHVS